VNDANRTTAQRIRRVLLTALSALREAARAIWSVTRKPVLFTLNILAALVILFEEWGWRPLSDLLARLAKYRPWAAIERGVASLPPYPSLLVFAAPSALLLPLKVVALWLLARGMVASAAALFLGAKVVSTALVARIFLLTKPALMRIPWFARAYGWFMPWKEHLFAIIRASWAWRYGRMLKTRLKLTASRIVAKVRPHISARLAAIQQRLFRRGADR
jgi:hypothetical protein